MTNFGLSEKTTQKLYSAFEKFPEIEKVIIYGSRAKGNYREGSDIDITLIGNDLTHTILLKLLYEIDELNTPYLYDVSIFSKLSNPEFIEHIHRVGKIFYQKKS